MRRAGVLASVAAMLAKDCSHTYCGNTGSRRALPTLHMFSRCDAEPTKLCLATWQHCWHLLVHAEILNGRQPASHAAPALPALQAEQLCEFLAPMLCWDPAQRASAGSMLQLPWLAAEQQAAGSPAASPAAAAAATGAHLIELDGGGEARGSSRFSGLGSLMA